MSSTTEVTYAWVQQKLREIHAEEMFGDCVECGQLFPCRTIQVLEVAGNNSKPVEQSSSKGQPNG